MVVQEIPERLLLFFYEAKTALKKVIVFLCGLEPVLSTAVLQIRAKPLGLGMNVSKSALENSITTTGVGQQKRSDPS